MLRRNCWTGLFVVTGLCLSAGMAEGAVIRFHYVPGQADACGTTAMKPAKYIPNLAMRTRRSLTVTGDCALRRIGGTSGISAASLTRLFSLSKSSRYYRSCSYRTQRSIVTHEARSYWTFLSKMVRSDCWTCRFASGANR